MSGNDDDILKGINAKAKEEIDKAVKDIQDDLPPDRPDMRMPFSERCSPKDMMLILETMKRGGYIDLEKANQAVRMILSQSDRMLNDIEAQREALGTMGSELEELKEAKRDLLHKVLVTKNNFARLLAAIEDNEHCETLTEALNLCKIGLKTIPVPDEGMYSKETIDVIAELMRVSEDSNLKMMGSAARERVVALCEKAAGILIKNDKDLIKLRELGQGLLQEISQIRMQLATITSQPKTPAIN